MKKILILFFAILFFTPAFAQLDGCTVDIRVELDLPFTYFSYGPRVFEVTGVTIGPGLELGLANETANPSYWGGALGVDIGGSGIIITDEEVFYGFDGANFQTASVQITNLSCPNGCDITDVIVNFNDVIQEAPPGPYYPYYYGGAFTFTQSFTNNSITLNWVIDNQDYYYLDTFWIVLDGVTDITVNCETVIDCEEEIIGSIVAPDPGCDVSGIDITIIAPDGTSIIVASGADGTFTVPGGPFICGTYTAAFTDPAQIPACYSENGSTEPIVFEVDGEGGGDDGPNFVAIAGIPTLSQWGLILMTLVLLTFGAVKISSTQLVEN